VHADDDTYSVTQATHTCFAEEIDLYLFSIRFQLANLQIYMSRKLRSYPVYASEIGMLISKLYCTGNQSSKHVDPALANFIANRINCCRGTLIADGNLLSSLRTCIPPKVELESLYRHTNMNTTTIENALQAFRHAVAATDTTAALLQTFERQHLNASSDPRLAAPPTVPIYERPTTGHSSGGAFDQTQEAVQILNAILRDKRVVRASQNCSGTLLSGPAASELRPNSRNEFRVDIGQYLVRLTDYRPRYSRTLVFCNASGEIGELPDTSMLAPIQDTNGKLLLSLILSLDANSQPYSPAPVTSDPENRWEQTAPKRLVEVYCSPYIKGLTEAFTTCGWMELFLAVCQL
jgi:hypothetical protein